MGIDTRLNEIMAHGTFNESSDFEEFMPTVKEIEPVEYLPVPSKDVALPVSDYDDDYIMISKEASGRLFRFIISENRLIPWSTMVYPNGSVTVGDKMWTKVYDDGGDVIKWVYYLGHSNTLLFRCMMIDS